MRTLIKLEEVKNGNRVIEKMFYMIDLETFKRELSENEYSEEQLVYMYNNNENYYVKSLIANKLNYNISHSVEEKMAKDNEVLMFENNIVVMVMETLEYIEEEKDNNIVVMEDNNNTSVIENDGYIDLNSLSEQEREFFDMDIEENIECLIRNGWLIEEVEIETETTKQ